MAKIFTKVLSLRLAPKLDALVSRNQNAFITGRSLHDNFILVRQSLRLLHQLGAPRIMLKLDLTRAFDSISWPFLFECCANTGLETDSENGWPYFCPRRALGARSGG
uniref:Reverse transcriptase domain-containing protein n=1 Tax=Aegilops tauschii subsp. strangulata TaxID=200361 RepID=A0A453J141_AEGTS